MSKQSDEKQVRDFPLSSNNKHVMSNDSNAMSSVEVKKAFLDLREEFRALNIEKPMAFVRWRHPELSEKDDKEILGALCGRATKKTAKHLPIVRGVLEHIKHAA